MKMFQAIYLALLCRTYLFCLKITGFWPFEYDTRSRRFKFNSIYLIVPFISVPYILVNYVLHINLLLDAVNVYFKNIVLKIISNVYVSSNVLNFVFLCATQTMQTKKIHRLIYRTIELYENTRLPLNEIYYLPYLMKFTIKSLIFGSTVVTYMIISMTLIAPHTIKSYMIPGFLIPVFINKFYPDIYYGGLLSVDLYLHQVNVNLKRILLNVTKHNDNELVDIADQLDTISNNYIRLLEIIKEFNQIMSFRVVLWIFLGLLNLLIHLFMQFVFVGIPTRYGHSLNIIVSASGVVDLFYQFMDIWMQSWICNSVLKKINETETMLSSMYVQLLGIDGPFTKSVSF